MRNPDSHLILTWSAITSLTGLCGRPGERSERDHFQQGLANICVVLPDWYRNLVSSHAKLR